MGKWLSYRVDKYLPEQIAAIAAWLHKINYNGINYIKLYKNLIELYKKKVIDLRFVATKLTPIMNTGFLTLKKHMQNDTKLMMLLQVVGVLGV